MMYIVLLRGMHRREDATLLTCMGCATHRANARAIQAFTISVSQRCLHHKWTRPRSFLHLLKHQLHPPHHLGSTSSEMLYRMLSSCMYSIACGCANRIVFSACTHLCTPRLDVMYLGMFPVQGQMSKVGLLLLDVRYGFSWLTDQMGHGPCLAKEVPHDEAYKGPSLIRSNTPL